MARRFRFRLEPLLKLRKQAEERQMAVVAEHLRSVERCRANLRELSMEWEQMVARARRSRLQPDLDVGMELQEQRWRAHLKRRITAEHERLISLQTALKAEQDRLADRSKAAKVLENLRERRLQAHRRGRQRAERFAADEIATQRYLRSLSPAPSTINGDRTVS